MNDYSVLYTPLSKQDLKDIYSYIAFSLKERQTAKKQTDRIKNEIKQLSAMPNRFQLVEAEPFGFMQIRRMPVDNYVVFYSVSETEKTVFILRVYFGGRDIDDLI